jgi:hypothetical protein
MWQKKYTKRPTIHGQTAKLSCAFAKISEEEY